MTTSQLPYQCWGIKLMPHCWWLDVNYSVSLATANYTAKIMSWNRRLNFLLFRKVTPSSHSRLFQLDHKPWTHDARFFVFSFYSGWWINVLSLQMFSYLYQYSVVAIDNRWSKLWRENRGQGRRLRMSLSVIILRSGLPYKYLHFPRNFSTNW